MENAVNANYAGSGTHGSVIYGEMPEYLPGIIRSYNILLQNAVSEATGWNQKKIGPHMDCPDGSADGEIVYCVVEKVRMKIPFSEYFTIMRDIRTERIAEIEGTGSAPNARADAAEVNDPMRYVTPQFIDSCINYAKEKELYKAAKLFAGAKERLFSGGD